LFLVCLLLWSRGAVYPCQGRRRFFFLNSGNGKNGKKKRQNGKLKKIIHNKKILKISGNGKNGKKKAAKRQTATTLIRARSQYIYIYIIYICCGKSANAGKVRISFIRIALTYVNLDQLR
jgi:hypothetical protein